MQFIIYTTVTIILACVLGDVLDMAGFKSIPSHETAYYSLGLFAGLFFGHFFNRR